MADDPHSAQPDPEDEQDTLQARQRRLGALSKPLGQPLRPAPLGHRPTSEPLGRLPEPDLSKQEQG